MRYEFEMPFPPSVNQWKTPFRGRMILTKVGRQYREKALNRLADLKLDGEAIDYPVAVYLELHPATNRKCDIDNFCKSLFDSLTKAGFWLDDSQIQRLTVVKCGKFEGGKVRLVVEGI